MSQWKLYGDAKATAQPVDANRKKRALELAQQQFDTDPLPENQHKLATALFDMGRFEEAERLLAGLLGKQGENLDILLDLGYIYKKLQRKAEATAAFKRVVQLDPTHPLAHTAEHELFQLDQTYRPSWMRK